MLSLYSILLLCNWEPLIHIADPGPGVDTYYLTRDCPGASKVIDGFRCCSPRCYTPVDLHAWSTPDFSQNDERKIPWKRNYHLSPPLLRSQYSQDLFSGVRGPVFGRMCTGRICHGEINFHRTFESTSRALSRPKQDAC